ncbi:uncharacterized protein ACIQIH_007511 isoform 2-T2 [Cyanocitta cristata]
MPSYLVFYPFLEAPNGKLGAAVIHEELTAFPAGRLASSHWKTSGCGVCISEPFYLFLTSWVKYIKMSQSVLKQISFLGALQLFRWPTGW